MSRLARTTPAHPVWCAGGHRCTADSGIGEHRSEPVTIATADARIGAVVTLTRPVGRAATVVEVRLSIRTPAGRDERASASHALSALSLLITVLAEELTS
jgi:hypothetical protein